MELECREKKINFQPCRRENKTELPVGFDQMPLTNNLVVFLLYFWEFFFLRDWLHITTQTGAQMFTLKQRLCLTSSFWSEGSQSSRQLALCQLQTRDSRRPRGEMVWTRLAWATNKVTFQQAVRRRLPLSLSLSKQQAPNWPPGSFVCIGISNKTRSCDLSARSWSILLAEEFSKAPARRQ